MQTQRGLATLAALLLASAFGCSQGSDEAPSEGPEESSAAETGETAGTAGDMMAALRDQCPTVGEDVSLEASDTESGVALTFTTGAGDVDALRRRVRHMADMYAMHDGHGRMMWHRMGGRSMRGGHMEPGEGHGAGMMGDQRGEWMHEGGPMPDVDATVENLEEGARIVLTPADPTQLDALRQHARWHAERMRSGECWMLEDQPSMPAQPPQPRG